MKLVKRMTPIAAALVTLAIVGAVGFFAVHQLKVEARQIVTDTLPGLSYGGQINAGLSDNFIKTLLAIDADDPAERAAYLKEIDEGTQKVTADLQRYAESIFDEADRERFDALVQHREKYRQIRQQVFALSEERRQPEARAVLKGWLWPAYLEYTRAAEKLFDDNITLGKARGQSILRVCTITQLVVTVVGTAVFVGGFLAPFIVVRYGGASRVRP